MCLFFVKDPEIFTLIFDLNEDYQITNNPHSATLAILSPQNFDKMSDDLPSDLPIFIYSKSGENRENIPSFADIQTLLKNRPKRSCICGIDIPTKDLYQAVFKNSTIGLLIFDENMTILTANDKIVSLSGYSHKELVNSLKVSDFIDQSDLSRIKTYHNERRQKEGKAPSHYECKIVSKNGGLHSINVSIALIPGTNNSIASIIDTSDFKTMKDQLEKSKNQYQEIFYAVGDGLLVAQGIKVIEANDAFESIVGLSREEVIGQNFFTLSEKFVKPKNLTRIFGLIKDFVLGNTTKAFEFPFRDKFLQISALPAEKNNLRTIVIRDITIEKNALDALKLSENKYRNLFENSPTGIISMAKDGQILDVNQKFLSTMGSPSREKTMKMNIFDTQSLIDSGFSASVKKCIKEEANIVCEHPYVSRWGKKTFFRYHLTPIFDEKNKVIGAQANMEDFTNYEITRKKLEESENLYRTLIESSDFCIALLDVSGKILFANTATARLHGVDSGDELLGKLGFDFVEEKSKTMAEYQLNTVLMDGTAKDIELELIKKDGTPFTAEFNGSIIYNSKNIPEKILLVVKDLTKRKQQEQEQKKLESQLRQSQKMESIGLLAGGVAHDFNNLLTPILGYSELLKKKMKEDDTLYKQLDIIHSAASRAKKLTWQLLAFGRKQILQMDEVDLNEIVNNFNSILKRTIRENIQIEVINSKHIYIKADKHQIEQILLNLVINGQEAIKEAGKIEICISSTSNYVPSDLFEHYVPDSRYAKLTITDSGVGIDPNLLENIFEPFFTTKKLGTGLGLSTVYGIIKQHHGFIEVNTEAKRGTTFSIYLPQTDGSALSETDPSGIIKIAAERETVLVVDDSGFVRDMIPLMLENLGYIPIKMASPKQALDYVKSGKHVDILLTDIVMPDMNGRELAREIWWINKSIKPVYMSGYSASELIKQDVIHEGTTFLQKPFSLNELSETLESLG